MATKQTGSAPKLNKAAFVRSLPNDLSAKEVVQKGKESGISLSEAYVYVIRAAAKKSKKSSKGSSASPKRASAATPSSSGGGAIPSKRAFIESQPADATAPAIIEAAKKVGLSISDTYIYVVRGGARKAGKGKSKAAAPAHKAALAVHKTAPVAHHVASKATGASDRFVNLVAAIGLDHADALLAQFRSKVNSLKIG